MAYRNYSVANGFTVDPSGNGDFTTIGAALAIATSGKTIFIRPGTYTENLTLVAGVNLCAFNCDALTPNVNIIGKATFTAAGTVSITGVQLQTNGDFLLAVTGSAASVVNLFYCSLNCSNNTGISFTSSSALSGIQIKYSQGNIITNGSALYSHSSAGLIRIEYCQILGSGSTTLNSQSSGAVSINYSTIFSQFQTTSTGVLSIGYSSINSTNNQSIVISGTGNASSLAYCNISSGTSASVVINAGATCNVFYNEVGSSVAGGNALTGAGTMFYGLNLFIGTATTANVNTQTARTVF